MTTSGAGDKAALLELAAAADTSGCARPEWMEGGGCPLDTWVDDAGHEPCGEGSWNDARRGWVGVRCDAIDGRVVSVELGETGVGGSLLPFFARLGALLIVHLNGNPALSGDVATLANATTLRRLDMRDCPLVRGEVGALATLVHLGEQFTMVDCPDLPGCPDDWEHDCSGVLWLAGSGVHGPVEALRDLPGLEDWGYQSGCEAHASYAFSSCAGFIPYDDRRRLMEGGLGPSYSYDPSSTSSSSSRRRSSSPDPPDPPDAPRPCPNPVAVRPSPKHSRHTRHAQPCAPIGARANDSRCGEQYERGLGRDGFAGIHQCACCGEEAPRLHGSTAVHDLSSGAARMLMDDRERSVQIRIAGSEYSDGGEYPYRGRLELNIDGRGWAAVCNDGFNDAAASAFCKELGYLSGTEYDPCDEYNTCDEIDFSADDIECPDGASSISV